MANIHIERKHTLGLDTAKDRVEGIAQQLKKELEADYRWQGDTLHFSRSGASGTIDVGDDKLVLDVKLGLALGMLKGKIEETIEQKINQALA
jgi:putative polyhydroxyalkanoate system protein